MTNLLLDPGFEENSPAWQWSAQGAGRWDVGPPHNWTGTLWNGPAAFPIRVRWWGSVAQQFAEMVPGEQYRIRLDREDTLAGATGLRVAIDPGDGVEVILKQWAGEGAGWVSGEAGIYTALGGTGLIRLQIASGVLQLGTWLVDNVVVEPVEEARVARRNDVLEALVTRLKTIEGAPYHTDVQGRVYRRLRTPAQLAECGMPALFVVQPGEPTAITMYEHTHRETLNVVVAGFVREHSEDPEVTTAAGEVSDLLDDVIRCLHEDSTLGGLLQAPMQFKQTENAGGMDPELGACALVIGLPWDYYPPELGV